jgi:hypothetical protein
MIPVRVVSKEWLERQPTMAYFPPAAPKKGQRKPRPKRDPVPPSKGTGPCLCPYDLYEMRVDPLGFMYFARHHCRGGRTRSERFMDRRGYVYWDDLNSPQSDVRHEAWALMGPFRKPIYPGRATNKGIRQAGKKSQVCLQCGHSLAGKRKGAKFCDQVCKKRYWRARVPDNSTGS